MSRWAMIRVIIWLQASGILSNLNSVFFGGPKKFVLSGLFILLNVVLFFISCAIHRLPDSIKGCPTEKTVYTG